MFIIKNLLFIYFYDNIFLTPTLIKPNFYFVIQIMFFAFFPTLYQSQSFFIFLFLFLLIPYLPFLLSASEVFIFSSLCAQFPAFSSSCTQFPTAPLFPPECPPQGHSSLFILHSNKKRASKHFCSEALQKGGDLLSHIAVQYHRRARA